jgi:hypothetical protein
MINVRSVAVGEPATGATSDRRLYLAGGFGGVLAAASWLVQPFLVLVVATADEGEFPTVDFLLANPWYGPVEAAVFTGIGVGLLLLVLAVGALLAQRAAEVSVPARVGHVLGVLAGCAWILLAGWHLAPFTSVGKALSEAAPDIGVQQAVLHGHNVGSTGIILAAGLAFAGWLISIATVGRAHGVIGWPLSGVALVAVVAVVLPMLIPFSPPWGLIGMQAYALAAGIAFLVRARKTS